MKQLRYVKWFGMRKVGIKMVDLVHKVFTSENSKNFEFVMSDASVDRYDDTIDVNGWDLKNFSKNPIALFSHDSYFPIGQWEKIGVRDKALKGHLKMAPEGTSPRIDELRKLIEAGILKAVSVGFRPIEYQDISNSGGIRYLKSELVECSLVAVPANPNAVMTAKSLKISDTMMKMVFAKHGNENILNRGVTWNGKEIPIEEVRTTLWMGHKVPARNF